MATLHGLLKKHPEWWRHLAVAIGEYGDIAANAPSDLMIPENERRVVAVLLRLCDCRFPPPYGGPPQEVPLTQAELAAMSNVPRNTLGTILRSLQDAGLISIGYGKIRPLQPERLRATRWRVAGTGMRRQHIIDSKYALDTSRSMLQFRAPGAADHWSVVRVGKDPIQAQGNMERR